MSISLTGRRLMFVFRGCFEGTGCLVLLSLEQNEPGVTKISSIGCCVGFGAYVHVCVFQRFIISTLHLISRETDVAVIILLESISSIFSPFPSCLCLIACQRA